MDRRLTIKVRQVKLQQDGKTTIGWLEVDKRIKRGARLTLKDQPGIWTVVKVYDTIQNKESIRQDWRVGGL